MTQAQLLSRIEKGPAPPAVLLLGPEAYERGRLKQALMATLPEDAVAVHDLAEVSLAEIVDDARSLSLFASERLIWVLNAEAALPRGRSGEEDEGEAPGGSASETALLAAYLKNPTPGVLLVLEAIRFDFEGDDKRKQDRVRKFYGAITDVIELRRFTPHQAHQEAEALARHAGFHLDPAALDLLVEALGADIARISTEIEKLSLYAGSRPVGVEDIAALVPDARATTIFALVNALGRRDRAQRPGDSRYTHPRRRVSAPGAGVPLDAIPHGPGRAGGRAQEFAADSGIFFAPGRAHVGIARRPGFPNGGQIRAAPTGARL